MSRIAAFVSWQADNKHFTCMQTHVYIYANTVGRMCVHIYVYTHVCIGIVNMMPTYCMYINTCIDT